MNRNTQEPSRKQLEVCYKILKRIGECEADEHGQPLFELSKKNADEFIKNNRNNTKHREASCTAGDWGEIPNH